jgi:hypothetical protein
MKLEECAVDMEVKARNCFGATYFITAIGKRTITVEHRTGKQRMMGGKWVPEVFEYKNRRPSIFTPVAAS